MEPTRSTFRGHIQQKVERVRGNPPGTRRGEHYR
jgi:hypothetical protein